MGIVIRQSIKGTIVNYAGAFIGFLTTMFVVTKFLRPDEIGLTKVVYEVAMLFCGFAQLGTTASAMRFFPYFRDPEKKNNGFFFYLMLIPFIGCCLLTAVYYCLHTPITHFFGERSALFLDYYNWVVPLIWFLTFWGIFEIYANLLMRIVIPKFVREVAVRVMLLVVYLLYAFHFLTLEGMVTGFVIVYGLAMLMTLMYISKIGTLSMKHDFSYVDKSLRNKFLKYTLFLIVGALSGNIIAQLDLFMITSQMGLNYAGIYTISLYIAVILEMPTRSITAISSPIAAAALKEGNFGKANALYKKVSLHQLIAGSTLFLFIWINIDNIFDIIPNGHIYEEGKWVVLFIALSKLIYVTLGFGGTLISFSRYYYWGLYITFFLTLLTIYTNYLLIPVLGVTGAAIATLITSLISYSFQQWIVLKKIKGNPYSIGTLKQIGIILLLLGINYLLPRWSVNPIADGLYRSVLIGGAWLFLTYRLKISEEIVQLIQKSLSLMAHYMGKR